MKPLVSVAIPTYNRLRYLKPCLESIKRQTIGPVRLYIFDDGSTEPVEAEARALFGEDVEFIRNERNCGASANIERALQYHYETPFVIVFHDDDVMHPRLLEEEVRLLERYPDAVFAATNISFCPGEGGLTAFDASAGRKIAFSHYADARELVRAFLRSINLGFSSVLYRSAALSGDSRLNFTQFGPNNDRPFLVELAQSRSCIFLRNKLVNYRVHPAQDSQKSQNNDLLRITKELVTFYYAQLPKPLSWSDAYLFRRFSTNALLNTFARCGKKNDSLRDYIALVGGKDFFSIYCINRTGLRALWRMLFKNK